MQVPVLQAEWRVVASCPEDTLLEALAPLQQLLSKVCSLTHAQHSNNIRDYRAALSCCGAVVWLLNVPDKKYSEANQRREGIHTFAEMVMSSMPKPP